MKKVISGFSVAMAVIVCVAAGIFFTMPEDKDVKAEIDHSVISKDKDVKAEISKNFELMRKNLDVQTAVSSNPFDYTENEYYRNIIAMGTEAIKPLDELLTEEKLNGLYAYLGALAIQEITQCDIYEVTGVDWSNAEEFKNLWNSTMADLPGTLNDIQNDAKLSIDDKKKETEKYGLFGKAYACDKETGEEINHKDLGNITEYMEFKSVH